MRATIEIQSRVPYDIQTVLWIAWALEEAGEEEKKRTFDINAESVMEALHYWLSAIPSGELWLYSYEYSNAMHLAGHLRKIAQEIEDHAEAP